MTVWIIILHVQMGTSWADLTGNVAYSSKAACEDYVKDWKQRLVPGDDVQCRAMPVDVK